MTQDEIIEMARQAGLHIATDVNWMPIIGIEYAEAFAKLVAEKAFQNGYEKGVAAFNDAVLIEREACAKVCDDEWNGDADTYEYSIAANDCAAAIRARGQA